MLSKPCFSNLLNLVNAWQTTVINEVCSLCSTYIGLAMGILARLHLAKIQTMARPNSPDMPPKRT